MKILITKMDVGSACDGSNYWDSPELIPSESVVHDGLPSAAKYSPMVFYNSQYYGLSQIPNFDIDEYHGETKFVNDFTMPELYDDTLVNRIQGKVFTYEMFTKTLPEFRYWRWDKAERKWVSVYGKIWILPTWEI